MGRRRPRAMIVHVLRGVGMDPSYLIGGDLRSTGRNAGWGERCVDRDRGRRIRSLAAGVASRHRGADERRARSPRHLRVAGWMLEDTFREFMSRASERTVVWDRPELRALCPADARPLRRGRRRADPGGRPPELARVRGRAVGARGPQRGQRRRCADRLRAGRRRSRGGRRRRSPTSRARGAGWSWSAAPPPARPSTTTTRTTRPRSRRRSRPHGRCARGG